MLTYHYLLYKPYLQDLHVGFASTFDISEEKRKTRKKMGGEEKSKKIN